ncbi:MAG: HD domain-containing protein [Methanobacteriota archaeon]|nr:MAG: HD domain-containing protein [Euryarchaeota archaeon]
MADRQVISQLAAGDKVDSQFSLAYKKPVTEYKYGFMFEFRVADRSGQMTAKYWGGQDRAHVELLQGSLERGGVVKIVGEVGEYRNQLELSVSEKDGGLVRPAKPEEYDISDLVASVDNIPEMRDRLVGFISDIEEPHLGRLLTDVFEDEGFMESFCSAPASIQLHSAAIGGLLQHTLNVVDVCARMLQIQPGLDRDLVLAGAMLHDIGKTRSFLVTTNINHTPEGNLLGHIMIGDELLAKRIGSIDGFPPDIALKLRHILASHHGKRDWGSPVEPMIPEALLVHQADDLDAKLKYMVARRDEAVTEDDWIWDRRLSRLIYLR